MRNKNIPDDYVGSVHLKNWLTKHMNMTGILNVFIPSIDCKNVNKTGFDLFLYGSPIYVSFKNKTMKCAFHEGGTNFQELSN